MKNLHLKHRKIASIAGPKNLLNANGQLAYGLRDIHNFLADYISFADGKSPMAVFQAIDPEPHQLLRNQGGEETNSPKNEEGLRNGQDLPLTSK